MSADAILDALKSQGERDLPRDPEAMARDVSDWAGALPARGARAGRGHQDAV
ncbi:MAG: hypothetical protein RI841_00600 [Halomonas sp.]|uniref:hypothetical protein n=1 Tax=Halomonas sp. TaxID=1486246 RepID=UPI00286FDF6D|nr:hypothetical protein [Halomonas sp.]MDR9437991.1 hypothetical protein [Halomonas sp.]